MRKDTIVLQPRSRNYKYTTTTNAATVVTCYAILVSKPPKNMYIDLTLPCFRL